MVDFEIQSHLFIRCSESKITSFIGLGSFFTNCRTGHFSKKMVICWSIGKATLSFRLMILKLLQTRSITGCIFYNLFFFFHLVKLWNCLQPLKLHLSCKISVEIWWLQKTEFMFSILIHMYSWKINTSYQSIYSTNVLYFLRAEVIFSSICLQEITVYIFSRIFVCCRVM